MIKLKLVPYKRYSESASKLRDALNLVGIPCQIVQRDSPTYRNQVNHRILNWGTTHSNIINQFPPHRIINNPIFVETSTNKLTTFQVLELGDISIPEFTTNIQEAERWLLFGDTIVCRTILNGTNGSGIVISETPNQLVICPLYVKYKKKKEEYRIHVFDGKVIDVQQKRKRREVEVNSKIRNLDNGWVFCREDINLPIDAGDLAIRSVTALGLTFGAVDIIYNRKEDCSYVLEVNTAPGLSGQTIVSYANAIKDYLDADN